MTTTNEPRWVTLEEASAASGVAVSTLRKWYQAKKIRSRLEPGPTGKRRVVPLDAVMEKAKRIVPAAELAEAMQEERTTGSSEAVVEVVNKSLAPVLAQLSSLSNRISELQDEKGDAIRRADKAEFKLAMAKRELATFRRGRRALEMIEADEKAEGGKS